MNKAIRIKTIQVNYLLSNYGSFLQHWALRTVLMEMGFSPTRYCDDKDRRDVTIIGKMFPYMKKFARIILHYLKVPVCSSSSDSIYALRKIKADIRFKSDYLKYIGPLVEQTDDSVYATILGGDQVLFPYEIKCSLQINSKKHIIYGASTYWNKESQSEIWRDAMISFLHKYDAIGLRENKGVELLSEYCKTRQIERVADPVMLVTRQQLEQLSGEVKYFRNSTMFSYFVNIKKDALFPYESLLRLSNKMNCELSISGIQGVEGMIPSKNYVNPYPHEFIRAIADSNFFVTNSYHGTVLALLLHTPFVTISQVGLTATQNIRQEELLDFFDLRDRLISADDLNHLEIDKSLQPINWSSVDERLAIFRELSKNWLQEALIND